MFDRFAMMGVVLRVHSGEHLRQLIRRHEVVAFDPQVAADAGMLVGSELRPKRSDVETPEADYKSARRTMVSLEPAYEVRYAGTSSDLTN
ncbi:MAG TPA: hypothetical protein VIN93_13935 [Bryobacteraceae bacterium]